MVLKDYQQAGYGKQIWDSLQLTIDAAESEWLMQNPWLGEANEASLIQLCSER